MKIKNEINIKNKKKRNYGINSYLAGLFEGTYNLSSKRIK